MTILQGRLMVLAVLAASTIAFVVFVAEPVAVPSTSMAPTLQPGDHLVINKVALRLSEPRAGEIVVFPQPGAETLLVKRIVGVGGDQVGIDDGILVVNGRPVTEPYVDQTRVDGVYFGPVTIPSGTVFVLGDERENSVDSRDFGPVAVPDLVGVVMVRLWPITWFQP